MTKIASSEIDTALEALSIESNGILDLINALRNKTELTQSFLETANLISEINGRVVLTGIGKSGHIAKKIQSTLASTGTPSLFVHPSEASHGDLGMIQKDDIILAVSASGETQELFNIIIHAKRFSIPLISITTNPQSTLAKNSSIILSLPHSREACPLGLAPTTSTLMQLAMGDALAITLLKMRHFSASDFGIYHPGGRLGSRLKIVEDLMHTDKDIPLGHSRMPITDAIMEMTRKALGCIGIISENGRLIGLITDGDLRRAFNKDIRKLTTQEIMNPSPLTIKSDMLAAEALKLMNNDSHPITCLFVVDSRNHPIGVLHIHDLLRAGIA
ncbi:MAG: KpsF/GutQ family sugar-phosphate isomerase [Commensalibacter sp.]|nr:KpsF/GutQ family sugar-phosphate isomerase [Commensalibacter sp.]